jgi:polysaccharide export outer membrane protein
MSNAVEAAAGLPLARRRPGRLFGLLAAVTALVVLAGVSGCSTLEFQRAVSKVTGTIAPGDETLALPVPPISADDPAYLVGPEDALEISVWKEDNLKSTVLVRPDGGISFPLAGDFLAAGKTASQIRDELIKRLSKFVPDPEVTVTVARVASYRIYVIGRVNKPGDIAVGRTLDVLQALSLAGGMTPFANEDAVRIIRRVEGKAVSIPFDYARIRKGGDLSQNITLKSGDVLFVP